MNEYSEYEFPGIYKLENRNTGKIYVGRSKNIRNRLLQQQTTLSSPSLGEAILEHGWNVFDVTILERVDDVSLLSDRELYWIEKLDANNPVVGYNTEVGTARGARGNRASKKDSNRRFTQTISVPEGVLREMKELAKDHNRSVSGEFVFAAKRWVRHCKEMNDEHTKSDDNSRAEPRA